MGGGYVSKEKFVSQDGGPLNCYHAVAPISRPDLDIDWIYAGNIPAYRSILDWLKIRDVGMIISLTIEKLKVGRNINHVPFDFDNTEWIDSDIEEKDLSDFVIEHIPIADAYYPIPIYAEKLLQIVSEYRQNYPHKKIYFHCWVGGGRTCTAVVYILMKLYNLSLEEAQTLVHNQYDKFKLKPAQLAFLEGDKPSPADIINSEPDIKTPTGHKCYDSRAS